MRPRGLARSGWRVTATRTPFSSALLSVRPTPATSGRVKTVPAIASRLIGSTGAAERRERRDAALHRGRRGQHPAARDVAGGGDALVRRCGSCRRSTISPRVPTSTPTDSRPSSSVWARMPMQMIACVPREAAAVLGRHVHAARRRARRRRRARSARSPCRARGTPRARRRRCRDPPTAGSAAATRAASRASRSSGRTRRTRSRSRRRRRRAAARAASCRPSTSRVLSTRWWSTCANGGSHGAAPVQTSRWSYSSALRAALGGRDQHAVALDRALAVDDRGLDQVEALAHAARLVLADEARVRLGAQQVDARAAVLEDEAARLGALDLGHRRGDLQQRLRRDAVGHRPVAAERHAVDDRDLGAERGGGRRGGVAGRAGSEDQEAHVLTVPE